MYLNADIPPLACWIRGEYLHDLRSHYHTYERAIVFGLTSIPGQALQFHALLRNGAQVARMPINAFVQKKSAPVMPLDVLEVWDCFSYHVSVHAFAWLKNMHARVFLKDGRVADGRYLFTVDWAQSPESESAGDLGHKNAHILELENGCYTAQPNNRLLWREPSTITQTLQRRPRYRTNSHLWSAENESSWRSASISAVPPSPRPAIPR